MSITPARFEGSTVIVTGAGSGIGEATATRLVQEGARVIACDISVERLDALHDEHPDIVTVAGDIVDGDTIARVLHAADHQVDGLANVAGIMDGFLPTHEITDSTWERVMSVNLNAMMRLTRAVLPIMLSAGAGSIVNVGSEAGLRGSAAGTAYTTSKWAVHGFTKSTAFFYTPRGIRCNAVAPGATATNIDAPFLSTFAAERLGPLMQVTVPKPATADELAAAITWLLSSDSSNVSGTILQDDGGWAAI